MAKKVYLFIIIVMILSLWSEIPDFIESLRTRGITGVNYGGIVFPVFIGLWAFCKYKKTR